MMTLLNTGLLVLGAIGGVLVLAILANVRQMRTLRNVSLIALTIMGCVILLAASGLVLIAGVPLLPARASPHIEMARSRIHIGGERDKAVQALPDAWYHADCRFPDGSGEDLFFYGPQNPREVRIVLISSKRVGEKAVVDFVGGLEAELLHLYDRCVPLPIIDALDPQPGLAMPTTVP